MFIFGVKPTSPSNQYGYFITKRKKNLNCVSKFIEKPNKSKAKNITKKRLLEFRIFFKKRCADKLFYKISKEYLQKLFISC